MNSGTGNLIGIVSYELASDEACQTKAQHEAGPSPSKPARHNAPAKAAPGPPQGRPSARPRLRQSWAALLGLCARAWRPSWAAVRACVFVCYSNPKATGICHMIKSNPKRFSLFN